GEHLWFWVSAVPVRDDGGRVATWYGCAANIEEMRIRREAGEVADRLAATFASIQDAFFTLDSDDRVSAINDEGRRAFSSGRDIVGEPAWRAMEALGRSRVALECRIASEQKRAVRFESY